MLNSSIMLNNFLIVQTINMKFDMGLYFDWANMLIFFCANYCGNMIDANHY